MFDRVEITVKAGGGGDGAISFRREKYVPYGGPDGGDGGTGGNVIIVADPSVDSLRDFRQKGVYKAGNGGNGGGQKKYGKNGEDLVIRVPEGTIALDKNAIADEALIADCEEAGLRFVAIKGGKGGLGNTHFTSSTNQAPRIAQKGEVGNELTLVLELRLIADVGIIGFPNAGKSTLLAYASAAKPKIAAYPFTTLEPILGIVEVGLKSFKIAEIPGLIEGAHIGRGLGHEFLRHIMRTKILIHLIDITTESPIEDMVRVNAELGLFDAVLAKKPQLVAVNKIDSPQAEGRIAEIEDAFSGAGIPVLFISAARGDGVPSLMSEVMKKLTQVTAEANSSKKDQKTVFRPQPKETGPKIKKEGDIYIIVAPQLERIVARVEMTDPEVRRQLQRQLDRTGISRILEKAGVKPGDKMRCGDYEWEW
ncbi:GTPase ObgE [Chloroflexota bacterium]